MTTRSLGRIPWVLLLALWGVQASAFVVVVDRPPIAVVADSGLFAMPKSSKIPVPTKKRSTLTPAQRLMQKSIPEKEGDEGDVVSEFDKIKNLVYTVGDGLSNMGASAPKESKIVDGYTANRLDTKTKRSPTLQLLDRIQQRPTSNVVVEPSPTRSVFDSVKDVLYETADLASSLAKKEPEKTSPPPIHRLAKDFKPVTKVRLETSREVLDAVPDLQSPNPIKRFIAEWQIRNLEFKENARRQKKQVDDGIIKLKEDIYAVGDFIQNTGTEIQALPGRIQTLAANMIAFFQAIPVTVRETIDTITAIPEKVEQKAIQVKTSVEETVDKTIQVVEDVKAFPSKVQQTAESTKQSVTAAAKKVEEVSTTAKVILGLEKPKPRPPKTPPPAPPGPSSIAWSVAGTVFSSVGKVVWWVGKGVADLSWKAVSKGAEQIKEEATVKIREMQSGGNKVTESPPSTAEVAQPKATSASAKVVPSASRLKKAAVPPSISSAAVVKDVMTDVEKLNHEVAEALQLASDALALAEMEFPAMASPETSPQSAESSLSTPAVAVESVVAAKIESKMTNE